MHFTKLKLAGFKSFIESTELMIEPGTTGIVGPNGCGKSNLVEALRWVMGETAPKQMRGGGMEDVIFNGTDARTARNVAEVALLLDNAERTAPAAFNEDEEIEVSRRIERGEGSSYRVNGRDVRARDVQYLFADFATGAHSSALVGQGRISDIINAKPAQRRGILEEAAGISGLHARRHEADLRLRAAETNLERLEDVVGALETQLQALKRQSRQANRYRRIAENLKSAEALLLHIRWSAARNTEEARAADLARETERVSELTGHTATAATAQSEAASVLPDLRQEEAAEAATLHHLAVARDRLEEEERQAKDQRQAIETRLTQIAEDLQREGTLADDAENAMATIAEQRQMLTLAGEEAAEAEQIAEITHAASAADVSTLEERISRLMEAVAATEAERATLTRRLEELHARKRLVTEHKDKAESEHTELREKSTHRSTIAQAEEDVMKAREAAQRAREAHRESETARETASGEEATARDQLQANDAKLSRFRAEAQALTDLLAHELTREGPGIVDSLEVEPSFEAALGAALGEDLEAPENAGAAIHWTALAPLGNNPILPSGVESLARFVSGSAVLARRLKQIGVVENASDGNRMQSELGPGQRLVSKEGGMWRWDGFTISASAPTAAASRLKQRNRLSELETELSLANDAKREAQQIYEKTRAKREDAATQATVRRSTAESAEEALNQARDRLAALTAQVVAENSRLSALSESVERFTGELTETDRLAAETRAALETAQSPEEGRAQLDKLRDEMTSLRAIHEERFQAHHRLSSEATQRTRRMEELARDESDWSNRVTGARQRLATLTTRQEEAHRHLEALAKRPIEIANQRASVLDQIVTAESARNQAADALARGEETLARFDETLKEAERATAQAREERVRIEGLMEQAKQVVEMIVEQIRERLACPPEEVLVLTDVKEGAELPESEAVEARIQRLTRERENIGAVNLRAEEEAADLDEQISTLVAERTDLEAAIARLRQGIQSLNRDGRQRVTTAFKKIDDHFRSLFTRLYGGGHARLELVESDDPLEAGLEILASPPGKRLQSLTLLSGGEKALTALALLFAVFLTNPAPICVLDEVDAPLDDSNVDRFCSLVAELAEKSGTRFIVVTHHRMTMSRVDRLYGVTMVERGVSQLVSVDLSEAEQWRQSA
ncbi:MAG: chromosome segregation protein SMC [Rhodospirillaceae bacterium]|nr:chromosome segregation protein SMC [Rhodospirillaceae bacterium]